MAAMDGVQKAYGRSFGEMEPVPMMRFARGCEVEIEEQTDDLGIMDLMRDQGVEYGEQVSNAQNDELLEKLFEEFLDLGFSPEDAAKKAREAFDDMSQGQGIKGTQVASGYKDDIEEKGQLPEPILKNIYNSQTSSSNGWVTLISHGILLA